MHPVAVKCIKWAAGLFLGGALAIAFGPEVFVRIADNAGANAAAGVPLIDLIITLVRWTTMPLGASLVGAAVVIQTLAPHVREVEDGKGEDGKVEDGKGEDGKGEDGKGARDSQ